MPSQFLKSTHLHFTPSSSNLCIISWFFIVSPQSAGLPLFIQPIMIAPFIVCFLLYCIFKGHKKSKIAFNLLIPKARLCDSSV